jgi:hypothetical protein
MREIRLDELSVGIAPESVNNRGGAAGAKSAAVYRGNLSHTPPACVLIC